MKTARGICACALSLAAAGCAGGPEGDSQNISSIAEELSVGQNQGAFLTLATYPETSEAARQVDTGNYYAQVKISPDGTSGGSISDGLATLQAFIAHYHFAGNEQVVWNGNRSLVDLDDGDRVD